MELTITTDENKMTFSRPGGYFVYLRHHDQPDDVLICENGLTSGRALGYCGTSVFGFEQLCRMWLRAHGQRRRSEDVRQLMVA